MNKIHPRKIFLIDALGALLSSVFLSFVLTTYEEYFGMPVNTLYLLAGIAALFCIYSFSNYIFFQKIWQPLLKAIAISNILYCLFTLVLVIYHFKILSIVGILYFALEIGIVLILARKELKIAGNKADFTT